MKSFQVLLILGGILAIIGVYVLYPPLPVSGNYNGSIPAGNYVYRILFHIYKTGRISGTFSETSGNSVTLYIFSGDQYGAFLATGTANNLFRTSGATGTYSALVSSPGDYDLVLQHGAGDAGLIQNVQVSYVLDGMNPLILGSGTALILGGIALGVAGYFRKRRTVAPRPVTDVILFDHPKP